jgi:aryl-alcohol dehydrogenase-like predicted oxidoreductase
MRGLDDLRQGKILYVGISDAPAWWIAQANTLAELRGRTQFVGLQIEYSLLERGRYLNCKTISPVWIWNSPPNN